MMTRAHTHSKQAARTARARYVCGVSLVSLAARALANVSHHLSSPHHCDCHVYSTVFSATDEERMCVRVKPLRYGNGSYLCTIRSNAALGRESRT